MQLQKLSNNTFMVESVSKQIKSYVFKKKVNQNYYRLLHLSTINLATQESGCTFCLFQSSETFELKKNDEYLSSETAISRGQNQNY